MTPSNNVVSLAQFRAKKHNTQELTRGRKPLYVSHLNKTVSSESGDSHDLGDRISRIKSSLERINTLMKDLKSMTNKKS